MSLPDPPSPVLLDRWLHTARRAADAAAAVHSRWAKQVDVRQARAKSFSDFVSRVDLEAQEAALSVIRSAHPDHDVLAEEEDHEGGVTLPDSEAPLWVVDPLDGTTNFLHDHPNYCASVAVTLAGRPLAGCVSSAPSGERWWAREGGGAFRNGRPIFCSPIRELEGALVATGIVYRNEEQLESFARDVVAIRGSGAGIRRGGAAAMDLCYVADGRFEAYVERHLSPWDFGAGTVIVREAGGRVERMEEAPFDLRPGSIFAVNSPEIGAGLRSRLRRSSGAPAS